ncbi:CU044_5270 family protein [Arthrobacter sp. ISL-65]|uniref:CU044_5270 family protein n=1 Tax=Arthrobacter sp. ISL-65 TaxID=2819112 RepID=UPI001BEB57B2|nr:CU044_5270 family protein [Arthrobacter sp. ISL-65]MBT2550536.1 CU044_5270 family protein [Arthrobacter sp. ISL-65]
MDDLQLLREMRSDIGSAPPATLARGRNNLMSKIGSTSRPEATTRTHAPAKVSPIRIRRRVLMASAAAALLVGGIVAADVVLPGQSGATAEAAEVLNNAAAATIQTSDPVVGPGQYLKIETTAVYSAGSVAADGTQTSWLDKTGGQVYVPADRKREWVWNREERVPLESSSKAAKAAAAEIRKADQGRPKGQPSIVGILRAPGGAFYGNKPTAIIGTPLTEAGSLPRDPRALLNIIQERTKGAGPSPEMEALITIADALRTGVIPADLRAALYKAAALIPGVTVVDKQATLNGKTGTAIGIQSPDGGARQEIIIDPVTGLMIGERDVSLKATADFPAGTATSWTSVQTSVVNSAP